MVTGRKRGVHPNPLEPPLATGLVLPPPGRTRMHASTIAFWEENGKALRLLSAFSEFTSSGVSPTIEMATATMGLASCEFACALFGHIVFGDC